MTKPVVCNAGPLIHLDQLGCLDLLSDFPSVLVPEVVWSEVSKHRPTALPQPFLTRTAPPETADPKTAGLCKAFSLDAGEAACLETLATLKETIFLTDDAAARMVGGQMGIDVHGTLGVLIRSVRRGKRSPEQVLEILDGLPSRSTLHGVPAGASIA